MICSKCNSNIPDGSRFCTECGAPCGEAADVKPIVTQVSSGKYRCAKCGLELEQGAKFCTACGEPTNVGNVAPIANNGETFGSGSMSAVSLDKEPDTGDLVAAMNSASAAPAPVSSETPVPSAVPAPTAPTPAPSPVMSGAAGFAPSGSTGYVAGAAMSGYNGMNGAAAVITAPPAEKKKISGGKIALIIVLVLVLLIGGAAVFFFTNKAAALSLIMGKPKYAAMVEKQSLKEAAEKLDTAVVSEQIKTISTIMSTMAAEPEDMFSSFGLSNNGSGAEFAKLMSISDNQPSVDIKGMLKGYNEYMKLTFGASRIYGSVTADISFGDKMRNEIGDDIDAVNSVLDIINGAEITFDMGVTEKLAGMEIGAKLGSKPINVRSLIADDGSVYAMFPFASDKAVKYKVPTDESATSSQQTAVLDYDEKEISRLLGELIEIYTDYIKESSVTMEKGGLVVAGIPVEGKQITADISGDKLEGMLISLFEHVANDTYFCEKTVEFKKSFDPDYTAEDYKNDIIDAGPQKGDIDDYDRLVVTTIVNNGGDILAKSYKAADNTQQTFFEILLAENDKTGAIEFKEDSKTTFTAVCESTSDTDGKVSLNIGTDDNESMGIIVTYSGTGKATFGKTEVPVGEYGLKFDVSGVRSMPDEDKDILNNFSLNVSNSVENGAQKSKIGLDVKGYVTANIKTEIALSDDMSKYDIPSNVIDIGDPNNPNVDPDTEAKLEEFGQEILTGLTDALKGTLLENIISGAQGMLPGSDASSGFGGTDFNDNEVIPNQLSAVAALEEQVYGALSEVYDWYDEFDVYSGAAYDKAQEYQQKLRDLDNKIWEVYNDCTDAQLKAYEAEFLAITASKDDIRAALKADSKKNANANTNMTAAGGINL